MEKDIFKFIQVVDEMYKNIDTMRSDNFEGNYKKIITFSLIDMMSKAVYGDSIKGHKNKFIEFISEFSNWEHADRISTQQLLYVVRKDTSECLNELRELCEDKLTNWPTDQPVTLDHDLKYEALNTLWPEDYKLGGKIQLVHLKHVNLLYSLRNSLVHESRPLGYSFDLFDDMSVPYYSSRGVIKKDESGELIQLPHESFELTHPIHFFYSLVESSIPKVKDHLMENRVNPYSNFRFSSEWVVS